MKDKVSGRIGDGRTGWGPSLDSETWVSRNLPVTVAITFAKIVKILQPLTQTHAAKLLIRQK